MDESKATQVSDDTKAIIEGFKVDPKSITADDKIIGHDLAEADLRLGVRLPSLSPHLVKRTGVKRTFLLHGPPGVGKSTLVSSFASTTEGCTIFKVKASLLGGWDNNKAIERVVHLFNEAKKAAPSAVLLDDVENILGRSSSEFVRKNNLMQKIPSSKQVVVIGVTSSPWSLDEEVWSLFDSHHHLRLPSDGDLIAIIRHKLDAVPHKVTHDEVVNLAEKFKGLSADKIEKIVCSVVSRLVREAIGAQYYRPIDFKGSRWCSACEHHEAGAFKASYWDIAGQLQPRSITYADFEGHEKALQRTVEILGKIEEKHAKWAAKHFYDTGISIKRSAAHLDAFEADNDGSE